MRTITFNAGNWSGKEMTITVKADGSFELYDYTFRLKFRGDEAFDIVSPSWSYRLGTGFKNVNDPNWTAGDDGYHMTRTHEDPFVAAAQLLCNII